MSRDSKDPFQIFRSHDTPPPALPGAAPLFSAAASKGMGLTLCLHPNGEEDLRALAKRRHDLKAALRTLTFTHKALASGYTFQDDTASAKIEAIGRALIVLERESEVLARLYSID